MPEKLWKFGEYVTGFRSDKRVLIAPSISAITAEVASWIAGTQAREFTVLGTLVDGGNWRN